RYAQDMKQYEAELARWEKAMAAWKRDKAAASSPPLKPDPPPCERFIVSDTTVEALAPILLTNPRGLLLARDELAGWIGSFDRYAGKGRAGSDAETGYRCSTRRASLWTAKRASRARSTFHKRRFAFAAAFNRQSCNAPSESSIANRA